MKKLPYVIAALFAVLFLLSPLLRPAYQSDFDFGRFGVLPVQYNGRLMPIDTLAQTTLRLLRGRTTVPTPEGETINATQWLVLLAFEPDAAHRLPVFRIDHPQLLSIIGKAQDDGKYYSLRDILPHMPELREAAAAIPEEAQVRSPFETALANLNANLHNYRRVGSSFAFYSDSFRDLSQTASVGISPLGERPDNPEATTADAPRHWNNLGEAVLDSYFLQRGEFDPIALAYTEAAEAWTNRNPSAFNSAIATIDARTDPYTPSFRIAFERTYHRLSPFYHATVLYVLAFLLVVVSWLAWPDTLRRSALIVLGITFGWHTLAIAARVYIQGYAPVTNLYSSAIVVGWLAVGLCLLLEKKVIHNGLGAMLAAVAGMCSLIVAANLVEVSSAGDTLEPMRAVLNSNFWLSTHVITITLGYGAMFVAGLIGMAYVLYGVFFRNMPADTAHRLSTACYGTIAFATLLSFIGTMLGGIWADQSWGRFWGWDPKENGAILIVLWCAILLHARWGRLVGTRGFLVLAIFGNIVTAWSWFGVNMLGIGLHSYGFMNAAFYWLLGFALIMIAFMSIGALPANLWRSPQAVNPPRRA